MAETIGAIIFSTIEAAGAAGASALGASTVIGSVTVNAVVGSAVILGASIGLQYALRPDTPKPSDGSQPIKQAVPPRIRGYGRNRMSGYYMLYEQMNKISFDICAFHSGRIGGIVGHYLHDDPVIVSGGVVQDTYGGGRYSEGYVQINSGIGNGASIAHYFGDLTEEAVLFNPIDHQPYDIAWFSMRCNTPSSPEDFTRIFPHNLPAPSVVADLAPVFDPRDPTQSASNPATWKISYNPVIQLMDYLTCVDGGMGIPRDVLFPPDRLAQWLHEADLCDEHVEVGEGIPTEPRYQSHGWYTFDTKPEAVINSILATCDGWMGDAGDGTQAIYVGVYRDPFAEIAPITEKDITGFSLSYGQADESTVNIINPTYTEPAANYVEMQVAAISNQALIDATGVMRAQALDLKWVHSANQANRLGYRALQRVSPLMQGSFTTTLMGLDYVGRRWIPITYPFISGLQNCVVENQGAEVDLLGGKITFKFNRIAPDTIDAYDPDDNTYRPPVLPPVESGPLLLRESGANMVREDGTFFVREYS